MAYLKAKMDILNITLMLVVFLLFGATGYLFILNRSSEQIVSKVVPAIIVGLVGVFLTIWFSLKENQTQKQFTAGLIAHAEKMTPLEEIKHDYHNFYGGRLLSPRTYINPIKDQKLFDFHFNLITTELLHTIFNTFQAFKDKPEGDIFSSSGYPLPLPMKRRFIDWESFIETFKKDPFLYDCLHQTNPEIFKHHYMTVPYGTDISYVDMPHEKRIVFHNEFIDFSISVYQWKGARELNEWKWILNLSDEEKDKYWISQFLVEMNSTTNKFRNGNPNLPKYEKWVSEIMTRLENQYDYNQQLKNAMEYHHYFGKEITK